MAGVPMSLPHLQHPQTTGCTAGPLTHRLENVDSVARRQPQQREKSPPHCSPGQRQELPKCPSPMTAGTEDSKHAGPRAFQAWPLHITHGQPKITAGLATPQGQAEASLL